MHDFYPEPPIKPSRRAELQRRTHCNALHAHLKRLFPKAVIAVETRDYGHMLVATANRFGRTHGVLTVGAGAVERDDARHFGGALLRALYPRGWAVAE